jgi:hypothetical protein
MHFEALPNTFIRENIKRSKENILFLMGKGAVGIPFMCTMILEYRVKQSVQCFGESSFCCGGRATPAVSNDIVGGPSTTLIILLFGDVLLGALRSSARFMRRCTASVTSSPPSIRSTTSPEEFSKTKVGTTVVLLRNQRTLFRLYSTKQQQLGVKHRRKRSPWMSFGKLSAVSTTDNRASTYTTANNSQIRRGSTSYLVLSSLWMMVARAAFVVIVFFLAETWAFLRTPTVMRKSPDVYRREKESSLSSSRVLSESEVLQLISSDAYILDIASLTAGSKKETLFGKGSGVNEGSGIGALPGVVKKLIGKYLTWKNRPIYDQLWAFIQDDLLNKMIKEKVPELSPRRTCFDKPGTEPKLHSFQTPDGGCDGTVSAYKGGRIDWLTTCQLFSKKLGFGSMRIDGWTTREDTRAPHMAVHLVVVANVILLYISLSPRAHLVLDDEYNDYGMSVGVQAIPWA